MTSRLRSVDGLLAPAVAETLTKLKSEDIDKAAERLARRYAAVIDESATIATDLAELASINRDSGVSARIKALSAKVEAQEVLKNLGPKLLDALEALGATPRARAAVKGKADGASGGGGRLAAIRSARSA